MYANAERRSTPLCAMVSTLKYDYFAVHALIHWFLVRSGEHQNRAIDKTTRICSSSLAAHLHNAHPAPGVCNNK